MDGIQTYHAPASPLTYGPPQSAGPAPYPVVPPDPASVKTPADYLRALRRRFWLVLTVGLPLGVAVTVWVLKQPPQYLVEAVISITPPQSDPEFSSLVSHNPARRDTPANERYAVDRMNRIKSRRLAEKIVNDPTFLQGSAPPGEEAVEELLNNLTPQPIRLSSQVRVTLKGTDATRTTKQLEMLLDIFVKEAKAEAEDRIEANKSNLKDSIGKLQNEINAIDKEVGTLLSQATFIGADGKNVFQSQYEALGAILLHKQMRLDDAQKQSWVSKLMPRVEFGPDESDRRQQLSLLKTQQRKYQLQLARFSNLSRGGVDPSMKHVMGQLKVINSQIAELQRPTAQPEFSDGSELIVNGLRDEIQSGEESLVKVQTKIRASIPEQQKYLGLKNKQELAMKRMYDLQTNKSEYEMMAATLEPPVAIISPPTEPTKPASSSRALKILLGLGFSFGLGIGLVCLFEHVDHSVKVPEHLTIGLTLPLLGVVPRIRRTALVHRGNHLWTPGDPGSVEADAYRNVRASLLGVADRLGALRTMLITSAKAGEGKSTTALNLAATCARAGERVLLMDVDLRRPSLADVFDRGHGLGLVDALRGDAPWQRAVVRTDLPNLDFLPTGDARGVPIEILSTLELKQLLAAVAGLYDRVILDGPAVLGMADCRMLGRMVDATVMVVRSGSHEMRPLQRAKSMLEQSHVVIAGVVFNGLADDLQNWSSYGPYTPYGSGRLGVPAGNASALPVAGSVEG